MAKQTSPSQKTVKLHLAIGWLGLSIYLTLGIGLEILHAMKVDFYLDLHNQTRRLMWTLAHSHGTLFSLLHIGYAATVHATGNRQFPKSISIAFTLGLLLMPAGFFLGGLKFQSGDPGIGVFLVPVGAFAILFGAIRVYRFLLKSL